MCRIRRWKTPFLKQCLVISSVTFNMISYGFAFGFNASLITSLRKTNEIPLNRDSESWLASVLGLFIFIGSIITCIIMKYIGRRFSFLLSSIIIICSWILFTLSSSFLELLIAKILQGITVGLGSLGSNLIGEYSSPKYRASFIATIPTGLLFGELLIHCLGLICEWRDVALVIAFLCLPGLIASVFSPESPSFLVTKGRYDECRKVFRWLRGTDEDTELEAMIQTDKIIKETTKNYHKQSLIKLFKAKLLYVLIVFRKREFRIPMIIMMHLNLINQFCGTFVNDMYTVDIHTAMYGTDAYMFQTAASLDVQRLVSTMLMIYVSSKVRRRPLLLALVGLNVLAYLLIAGYIYGRRNKILPFDHMAIGIILHHFHFFSIGTGSFPLVFIISGEIYPLTDKGYCVLFCSILYSIYMFTNIKTAPYLFSLIGIEGAFCVYAILLFYCLAVTLYLLPETKDKTLQEIENEFRGYAINHETVKLNA
ncbi:facilitated trehalose transporter Tret1 [Bombyx mori]|uniref:Major facilitator superfamily (MFS) profile domain-containing protein n=1 Tax=Bombyx mori TaxID=7091 RepID=A0A8R2AT74_BOMMO|nr:facilitated trehalose transporter Tret1-like isoform X1 [Bombyx mori]XP_021203603.1 facilitated trehalose transporter Tret1-like isoform X2 [Bombyx mori]